MLKAVVSMWSLASCLGDSIGQDRQASTALALVQQSAGSAVAGRAAALAGFQKFADGLVAQYMETRIEPNSTTKTAIETVITWIDTFYGHFLDEHGVDVGRVNACPGDVEQCITDHLGNDVAQKILDEAARVVTARNDHLSCLTTAKSCHYEQSMACNDYDSHRANSPPPLPACVKTGGAFADTFIQADEDDRFDGGECIAGGSGVKCLPKMEECLVEFKTWFDQLYNLYDACKRTDDPCRENCKPEQHEFEIDHCEAGSVRSSACTSYNGCVSTQKDRCAQLCTDVEINSNARKADNETGERIVCLLNALIHETVIDETTGELGLKEDKPKLLAACVNATYDTSEFTIACPAGTPDLGGVLVDAVDCTADLQWTEPVTCTEEFLAKEYVQHDEVEYCYCRQCIGLSGPKPVQRNGTECSTAEGYSNGRLHGRYLNGTLHA